MRCVNEGHVWWPIIRMRVQGELWGWGNEDPTWKITKKAKEGWEYGA
jgi:hypothetical protein